MYEVYIKMRDSTNNEGIRKSTMQKKFQYEYEKKQIADREQQSKKEELAKAESKKQKIIILFITIGLLFAFLVVALTYRNLRITNRQKKIIELKNAEIMDSIEYALRIQTAILPPQKIVKQYLENSFILYKPKDIVAGDFYWIETVNDIVLFAACDCTGHGVPGAMVSVVCHNALNRAVREFGLTQPASILDKTAEIVLENFSKSDEEIHDGMDISICALDTKSNILEWSGANNSLLIIANGKLTEIRADKQCIGYNDSIKPFTNHQFQIQHDTSIYLFTDGYPDQFGGEPERKLTKKRFKELLLSIQPFSIQEQATELDNFITNYRKELEQTDDILVVGVKI
jgi:serine phosphatase RsbU (regulator of sigma subunit)